jgi:hypothetical protein
MFANRNLTVLQYAMSGWTAWHYQTKGSLETVEKDGYFEPVKSLMRSGDVIYITFDGESGKETAIRVINIENGVVKLKNIM